MSPREPSDTTLLLRLLEGCQGRVIELADLFTLFSDFAQCLPSRDGGEADEQQRFGQALVDLHLLGLHAPAASTGFKVGGKRPFSGWKTRKRLWGRVWVKDHQRQAHVDSGASVVEAARAEAAAGARGATDEAIGENAACSAEKKPDKEIPSWARGVLRSRPATSPAQAALLKQRARGEQPPGERTAKRQKVRMFMN